MQGPCNNLLIHSGSANKNTNCLKLEVEMNVGMMPELNELNSNIETVHI